MHEIYLSHFNDFNFLLIMYARMYVLEIERCSKQKAPFFYSRNWGINFISMKKICSLNWGEIFTRRSGLRFLGPGAIKPLRAPRGWTAGGRGLVSYRLERGPSGKWGSGLQPPSPPSPPLIRACLHVFRSRFLYSDVMFIYLFSFKKKYANIILV